MLIAEIEDAQDRTVEWRVYSGPPRGPIGIVRAVPIRDAWVPALVDVNADRVLIVEARPEPDGPIRAFPLDSVAGLVAIPWARASALPLEISGGFAAAAMAGPNRVAVLDLATGAELVGPLVQPRAGRGPEPDAGRSRGRGDAGGRHARRPGGGSPSPARDERSQPRASRG